MTVAATAKHSAANQCAVPTLWYGRTWDDGGGSVAKYTLCTITRNIDASHALNSARWIEWAVLVSRHQYNLSQTHRCCCRTQYSGTHKHKMHNEWDNEEECERERERRRWQSHVLLQTIRVVMSRRRHSVNMRPVYMPNVHMMADGPVQFSFTMAE